MCIHGSKDESSHHRTFLVTVFPLRALFDAYVRLQARVLLKASLSILTLIVKMNIACWCATGVRRSFILRYHDDIDTRRHTTVTKNKTQRKDNAERKSEFD